MIQRFAALCCTAIALVTALPASAQIILGGEPVATPGEPAAPVLNFPVDPDKAGYVRVNVATPAFTGATPEETAVAARISDLVRADLASIGLFTAPDSAAIASFAADVGALPAWADWSGAGAGALLLGKAVIGADQSLTIQYRLYDVAARKQLAGTQIRVPAAADWRRLAHKAADDVLVALTGGKGGFDSQIAFVSEAGDKTQFAIIDQDGADAKVLFPHIAGLESPRFSPTLPGFIYSADAPVPGKSNQAQRTAITYDIATGRRDPVTTAAQPGADVRYAPDGLSLIYSRKAGANTDIYSMALSTRAEKRLTDDKAADTEPTLSPDGKTYAFVSDRSGSAQIHLARVDGAAMTCADGAEAAVCRLTTDGAGYGAPAWSPRGDWIVFTKRTGGQSSLHAMKADGSETRTLTTPGADVLDLHPSWSPDGRRIAFSRVAGSKSHLSIVQLAGGEPIRVPTASDAYDPDWGPKRQ